MLSAVFRSSGSLDSIHPSVIHRANDVHTVTVSGSQPFEHQLDGDHLGTVDELRIEWEPDALRLVTPVNPLEGNR